LSNIGLLRDWFQLGTPFPGDSYTVNVGQLTMRGDRPFNTRHAASLRAIYDLSSGRGDAWMIATGQAGHPLSKHYGALLPSWQRVKYLPVPWSPSQASTRPNTTLVLKPR
jgi:penicillin amidase